MVRFGSRAVIAGVVLALVAGASAALAGADSRGAATRAGLSVTLITGDRAIFTGTRVERSSLVIRPGVGREKTAFRSYRSGGHFYVVPADAARLVDSGQVDRRLFDVALLIRSGYDDAHRDSLPVIVTYAGAAPASLAASGRDLPSINGSAFAVSKRDTTLWGLATRAGFAAARIRKVWLDGRRSASLDRSAAQIGAPAAWAAGLTGAGVTVAILDTGVDETHPDLAGRQLAERNFTDAPDGADRNGHGTHVASIAAGSGAKAGGKFRGIASGAAILDAKVLGDDGLGLDSWTIAGMQWAADLGARVANLSLGNPDTEGVDPVEEAVNTLSAQRGILFVAAAGNSGIDETSVDSPASADAALAVGAVDRNDTVAPFSNRGPRAGDGAIKPDITAPGVDIVAAKAANGIIGRPVQDGYVASGGTSAATPHVTGAAALLAQRHPDWTGQQLKAALTASAKPAAGFTPYDQGSGRVDVARAIRQTVITEPTDLSLGTQFWPHGDDQPVTKLLTYHNFGATDVTLSLAVEATGPTGEPSAVFSLSANEITVPAGGRAEVALTGDTRSATLADGAYTGTIVASAGDTSVRTPIAINREAESYNLTINARDLDGNPTADYSVTIIGLDDGTSRFPYDPSGSLTVRLPKGRYFLDDTVVTTAAGGTPHTHLLPHPDTTLSRDTTVDLAASASRPISVTAPDPAATLLLGDIGYAVTTALGDSTTLFTTTDLSTVSIAQLGSSLPAQALTTRFNTQWATPGGAFYGLAWFRPGTVPTGFTKVVRQNDVATVRVDLGTQAPGRTGQRFVAPNVRGRDLLAATVEVDLPLPSVRTEFYNSDDTEWKLVLLQVDPATSTVEAMFDGVPHVFQPRHTYRLRFNHGPFGPAFPPTPVPWVLRSGDIVDAFLPLFSDSAGNAGLSLVDSGATKLFRDGQLVGESPTPFSGTFAVPSEDGAYRLTTEAVRPATFDTATRFSAEWTFRSAHVAGSEVALPLPALRFSPRLDGTNTAPAGHAFLIPVALQLQSSTLIRPRHLSVEVSYDEGATWQRADIIANLAVLLHHPAHATSVSLRATASDPDGNTVTQTVIRAYKLSRHG